MPCSTPGPLAWQFRSPSGGSLCVTKPPAVQQSMREALPEDPSIAPAVHGQRQQ